MFILHVTVPGLIDAEYLEGPRPPKSVRSKGYRFTNDKAKAWPFESATLARVKGRVVDRHMGWEHGTIAVVPADNDNSSAS